jgi:hypothetical protein
VPMLVTIDVIEPQPGGKKSFELCRNFIRDLPAHRRIDKYPDAGQPHITAKPAGAVDKIGQARGRRHRVSVGQNDVQSHLQRTHPARPVDRVGSGGSPNHETGRRQDAVAVSRLNRLVDFGRKTKIVGRYNQRLQCATPRRSRRK